MTSSQELRAAATAARVHADNLRADIVNAQTRIEGMRITRLALEADGLASTLELMADRPDVPQDRETDGLVTDHFPTH